MVRSTSFAGPPGLSWWGRAPKPPCFRSFWNDEWRMKILKCYFVLKQELGMEGQLSKMIQAQMPSRRLTPDALSFNGSVAAMESWKRSQSLLEQLPLRQLELDTFAYRAVVEKVTWEIALDLRDT